MIIPVEVDKITVSYDTETKKFYARLLVFTITDKKGHVGRTRELLLEEI